MGRNLNFPYLFKPGQIGNVSLRNRIVQGPTERDFMGANGEITSKTVDYYVERAKGGFGLIIVGALDVGLGGRTAHMKSLGDNRFILPHCDLTEGVHAYGAKISAQLMAVGRNVPWDAFKHGEPSIGPSPIPARMVGEYEYPTPRPLQKWEIYHIMDLYGEAAYRARAAGYDMVNLHGAHGFLINCFMSPFMNQRTDEFGGSLENRMRFALGVIARIQQEAGKDFPIDFRLSSDEFVEGGITVEEAQKIAQIVEEAGVASINATAGIYETYWKCNDVMRNPEGWKSYIWEGIRKAVNIPVMAQGTLASPEVCERVLAEGKADFVMLTRGAIADAAWPNKAAQARVQDISKCISCNECHPGMGGLYRRDRFRPVCSVNAEYGREREFTKLEPASKKKRVMVIGSGPAGMEAARVASMQGHQVTLYERWGMLGGQLFLASIPPGKDKIRWYWDYLTYQIEKAGVETRLNIEVTPELVSEVRPDAIIVATGAEPVVPNIPGIRNANVVTFFDVLLGKVKIENQTVVLGGGGTNSVETAEYLSELGNAVSIIERWPLVARDMELLQRKVALDTLKERDVKLLTEQQLAEITNDSVIVTHRESGAREDLQADWVILALGMKPLTALFEALETLDDFTGELYMAGDCQIPRKFPEATYEGSLAARLL